MSDAEYQLVLHALDAARARFGLDLITSDGAAERIRMLINLKLHAAEATAFGISVARSGGNLIRYPGSNSPSKNDPPAAADLISPAP